MKYGLAIKKKWFKRVKSLFFIAIILGIVIGIYYKNNNAVNIEFNKIAITAANFNNNTRNNLNYDQCSEGENYNKYSDYIRNIDINNYTIGNDTEIKIDSSEKVDSGNNESLSADIQGASIKNIADTLLLDKKVTEIKDENGNSTVEYEVELIMNKIGADIVFAIDNSYSFSRQVKGEGNIDKGNKWSYSVLPYFERLVQRLLEVAENNKRNIRIGIVVFSGSREKIGSIDDATVIQYFSDDIDEITNNLKSIDKFGDGGYSNSQSSDKYVDILNIEAGLLRAKEMFNEENFAKYVLLYADGPPTISINENYSARYDISEDKQTYPKYRDAAFKARDILSNSGIELLALGEKINTADFLYSNSGHGTVKKAMIETLSGITNIKFNLSYIYENEFFLDESSIALNADRSKIFGSAYRYLEYNVLNFHENINDIYPLNITDEISEDFIINTNGYGEGKVALISSGNKEEIFNIDSLENRDDISINISDDGKKINFNGIGVDYYGTTIKYKVKLKDDYLIKNDVLNGINSLVTCEDLSEKSFNNPILNIKPIVNISTTENNLSNIQENQDNVSDTVIFIENISTKEQFKLTASEDNHSNYEFVMRKVSDNNEENYDYESYDNYHYKNNDNIGEFLTIGQYKIKEVNVLNTKELVDIKINGRSIDINDSNENIFLIDKQNSNIFIEICTIKKVEVIKGKINIESITLDSNGNKVSSSDKSSNEAITLRLKLVDDSSRYDFKINLNDNISSNFYIVNNYYEIPKDIESGLGIIKVGVYKIEEVLPMNIILESIEIKYGENDQWNEIRSDDVININKDSTEVFMRLNHKNNNKKYWFKKK